jgi:hypothetical protein
VELRREAVLGAAGREPRPEAEGSTGPDDEAAAPADHSGGQRQRRHGQGQASQHDLYTSHERGRKELRVADCPQECDLAAP